MTTEANVQVPARGDQLAVIGEFITGAAQSAGLNKRAIYQVQTAVDEACANIIYHAYAYEGQGPIELRCECRQNDFVVTITDYGTPFDPDSVATPDINAGLDERKEGGLGTYLMRCLMDEVRYQFTGAANILTMVKHIRAER